MTEGEALQLARDGKLMADELLMLARQGAITYKGILGLAREALVLELRHIRRIKETERTRNLLGLLQLITDSSRGWLDFSKLEKPPRKKDKAK